MKLVVFSHKPCWTSPRSRTGVATDGGFAFQMAALSGLFDLTTVCVPVAGSPQPGEALLQGERLVVTRLPRPMGSGVWRKVLLPFWLLRAMPALVRAVRSADAVHAPIPGDVGTIGLLLAHGFRKPLFVRHCGNWSIPRTIAERGWRGYMERFAGGRNVMLATGGGDEPPSAGNPNIRWVFSSSLTATELQSYECVRTPPDPASPRLIIVGRQVKAKGTATAVSAIALLVDAMPGIHLDVIGDGPDLPAFRHQARDRGVEARVTFHGSLGHDEVMSRLGDADIFVFPTTSSEGFPKVVVEAMAVGLPVLATAVSVLPDLLGHGAGIVLPEPSPTALADAVRSACADAGAYRRMSEAARATAESLSLDRWAQLIGHELEEAWCRPLRGHVMPTPTATGSS